MNLSQLMIAELLFIHKQPIRLSQARVLHQATLKALLNRRLIHRNGQHIETTSLGEEVASRKQLNKRKYEADVVDSVKALLHVSKIVEMRRAS